MLFLQPNVHFAAPAGVVAADVRQLMELLGLGDVVAVAEAQLARVAIKLS